MAGSFNMFVGCVQGGVSFTDSSSLVASHALSVGDNATAIYTFYMPTASLNWCYVQSVDIVDGFGNAWTENVKLVAS